MMRFLLLVRLGLRRASRHWGMVLLVYLASLLPALLLLSQVSGDLAGAFDRSLFAGRLLEGDSMPVWIDFTASDASDLGPVQGAFGSRWLLGVLLQILLAAGLVEVLLEREARKEHPFLLGVGRHGWRFVRAALVFAVALVPVVLAMRLVTRAFDGGDDQLQVIGWGVAALVGLLLFALADLAYDFSRIAAAAHGEGRMLVGYLKALGFVFGRLGVLLPLYLLFALVFAGLQAGYVLARAQWLVSDAAKVAVMLGLQQMLFLLFAFLRVTFWGAEVAYYQGVGEPRLAGGPTFLQRRRARRKERRQERERAAAEEEAPERVEQEAPETPELPKVPELPGGEAEGLPQEPRE